MSSNEFAMPKLGMGTYRLQGDQAYDNVKAALDIGYRHIDTAQMYANEVEVGRALKNSEVSRQEVFVTTKVWNDKLNRKQFLPSVQESLVKLNMDYVDLLLVHWPSPEGGEPMEEYLGELLAAKEQGLAKYIGLSNFTIAQVEQAKSILPEGSISNNQIEVHPYLSNRRLRQHCLDANISVTGYMPLAVGKAIKDPLIIDLAKQLNTQPATLVIAWEFAHNLATIPSSTKRENLETNFEALQLSLSQDIVEQIDQLNCGERIASPGFAPQWDE